MSFKTMNQIGMTDSKAVKENILNNIYVEIINAVQNNKGHAYFNETYHEFSSVGNRIYIADVEKVKSRLQKEGFKIEYITENFTDRTEKLFGKIEEYKRTYKCIKVSLK